MSLKLIPRAKFSRIESFSILIWITKIGGNSLAGSDLKIQVYDLHENDAHVIGVKLVGPRSQPKPASYSRLTFCDSWRDKPIATCVETLRSCG